MEKVNDELIKKSESLVKVARLYAIGTFNSTFDRINILEKANPKDWDFFITVATVFITLSSFNRASTDEDLYKTVCQNIAESLKDWHVQGIAAFDDCKLYFEKMYDHLLPYYQNEDKKYLSSDSIGSWVTINVFHKIPVKDERDLIRITGMITHKFHDYWKIDLN